MDADEGGNGDLDEAQLRDELSIRGPGCDANSPSGGACLARRLVSKPTPRPSRSVLLGSGRGRSQQGLVATLERVTEASTKAHLGSVRSSGNPAVVTPQQVEVDVFHAKRVPVVAVELAATVVVRQGASWRRGSSWQRIIRARRRSLEAPGSSHRRAASPERCAGLPWRARGGGGQYYARVSRDGRAGVASDEVKERHSGGVVPADVGVAGHVAPRREAKAERPRTVVVLAPDDRVLNEALRAVVVQVGERCLTCAFDSSHSFLSAAEPSSPPSSSLPSSSSS